ncbi:hypothetical protein SISSUDRAFT_1045036 [Sistotremastrum suecicum HHB10207 ss-3]|uniref:HAD-like protein n=1 Tax=Sistotremastrum suecicum HHB10207 ss-3 TaxID=1314776 RepID=A0A166ESG0_9AGAM|nr:hypothetical protein SISSUDRAFT_1045036 [Sistotremastrum suecicum HHB10207 ss-3]
MNSSENRNSRSKKTDRFFLLRPRRRYTYYLLISRDLPAEDSCSPLQQYSNILKRPLVVADSVRKFKPAPEIYQHLLKEAGLEKTPEKCWVVSGNPFDVVGARKSGLNSVWVDRSGTGWIDQLGEPTKVIGSLEELSAIFTEA